MHGRKRLSKPPSAEEVAQQRSKAEKYRKLMVYVREKRRKGDTSEETLRVVGNLQVMNADVYTLWNYRKEMLGPDFDASVELTVTAQCLKKNPKSYSAWYHRRWVLERRPELAATELALCAQFLEADERNFHCWNHRRFASALAREPAEEVVAFALSKLEANFSNYSAFHELSNHLCSTTRPELHLDIVAQAVFTEPDDQSAWWFLECLARHFLCKPDPELTTTTTTEDRGDDVRELFVAQLEALTELRKLEPQCKWPVLASFRLHRHLHRRSAALTALHADLLRLDPVHAHMYSPSSSSSSSSAAPPPP